LFKENTDLVKAVRTAAAGRCIIVLRRSQQTGHEEGLQHVRLILDGKATP
jgi:hypothetical protein